MATKRPDDIGDLRLATVCVNATDMDRAADFWSATLGATRAERWPYPDEHDFVVLRDTEGNEFCVIAVASEQG